MTSSNSRIHADVLQVNLQTVALGDLVSEALAAAHPVARAAGVRVDGAVEGGVTVHADPAGLSRVVANLVMNAIRYTPTDGAVSIQCRAVDHGIELSVTDGCGGIPEGDLDRVFDIAWRGSQARTPEADIPHAGAGAGLGLAIVKGIVEAHHGQVLVRNEQGGCRFLIRLP